MTDSTTAGSLQRWIAASKARWILGGFGRLVFLVPRGMLRRISLDPRVCLIIVACPRSSQIAVLLHWNDDV